MNLLKKYLDKINVKEFSELSEEEKETYRSWEEVLSGRKLTDDDVAQFLGTELDDTLNKLEDPKLSPREDVFLKMKLSFVRKINAFLNSPEVEKKTLEENIKNIK